MFSFLFDILEKTTRQLYTRMLESYEVERIKKIIAFNKDAGALRQDLAAKLYRYIHERKEKQFKKPNVLPENNYKLNFSLNISHGHEQYFSTSSKDLFDLQIYEYCLDVINQINDIETANGALTMLKHFNKTAKDKSLTITNTIEHIIQLLENQLDEYKPFKERNKQFFDDLFDKKITSPQRKMVNNFLHSMNNKINKKYSAIAQQYPNLREYMGIYFQHQVLEKFIEELNLNIFNNNNISWQIEAYFLYYNSKKNTWEEIEPLDWSGRELYKQGLDNKSKKNELEFIKRSHELKLIELSTDTPAEVLETAKKIALVFQETSSSRMGIFFDIHEFSIKAFGYAMYSTYKNGRCTSIYLKDGPTIRFTIKFDSKKIKSNDNNRDFKNACIDDFYSHYYDYNFLLSYFSPQELKQFKNNMLDFISQEEKKLFPVSLQKENQEIDSRYLRKIGLFGHKDDIALPPQMIESPFAENVMYEL